MTELDETEFLARIDRQLHGHFGWTKHESACWTIRAGGQNPGEPDFSHKCKVHSHLMRPSSEKHFVADSWWKWTVKVGSGGVAFRARGYVKSMAEGKVACESAVRTLALGILAQFKLQARGLG
jgi:hypothetical protein